MVCVEGRLARIKGCGWGKQEEGVVGGAAAICMWGVWGVI